MNNLAKLNYYTDKKYGIKLCSVTVYTKSNDYTSVLPPPESDWRHKLCHNLTQWVNQGIF